MQQRKDSQARIVKAVTILLGIRINTISTEGGQWLSGRVLDSRPKGHGFEPHRRHCVVSLSKNINPSLVLVQPRKTRPFITERLLMGRKESNQTNKQYPQLYLQLKRKNKLFFLFSCRYSCRYCTVQSYLLHFFYHSSTQVLLMFLGWSQIV